MFLSHTLQDHSAWSLILAVLICFAGAMGGLMFWTQARDATGSLRLSWGFLSAIVLGATVWTTHFVAMLGYHASAAASFDPLLTGLSIVIAVFGMALAIAASLHLRDYFVDIVAGTTLGLSVATMHFTGMLGFQIGAQSTWANIRATEAVLIGVVLGIMTIRVLRTADPSVRLPILAATCFSAMVAAVHFIAMAVFDQRMSLTELALPPTEHSMLALGVAGGTVFLFAMAAAAYVIQASLAKEATSQIAANARTDALTGVHNRAELSRTLDESLASLSDGGPGLTLLLIDLDRFKAINDGFGHAVGDEVLRRCVGRIQSFLGKTDFLARLGGDEFALIQQDTDQSAQSRARVQKTAQRINELLARPMLIDGIVAEIGASVGIAQAFSGDTYRASTLMKNADMALYAAKAAGRSTWKFFERAIAEDVDARRQIEFDLRRAVARNEFVLHFQPLVDSQTRKVIGAEALIRWQHPTKGRISPDIFIPIAEDLGLIIAIGKWVIERACCTARNWPDHVKISVNLSTAQLKDPRLVQTVREALSRSGLAPSRLELEVTETALILSEKTAESVLSNLRALGVSISLDDFGTGFSSLSHLHKFPLDRIKIDRSFIELMQRDEKSAKIVQSIGNLGTVLGLGVTAEGIETEAQSVMVSAHGCDVLQGFLYSRPLALADFETLLGSEPPDTLQGSGGSS